MIEVQLQRRKSLISPTLFLACFASFIPQLLTSLLLVEIGISFDVQVGIAGQILSAASGIAIVLSLLMGFLSVRYSSKTLLVFGLGALSVMAASASLAPSFLMLFTSYLFYGVSLATIQPQSFALIGQYFAVDERPKKMSYLIAGLATAYLVGAPIIGLLGDWRLTYLVFVLPLALLSLVLARIGLPPVNRQTASSENILQGFHAFLKNRSAIACVLGNICAVVGAIIYATFYAPFLREQFLVEPGVLTILTMAFAGTYIGSTLLAGRIVHRIGRKPMNTLFAVGTGLTVFAFALAPSLPIAVVALFSGAVTMGMRMTAVNSLFLEQLPVYRGSMMSLYQVSQNTAQLIGTTLAGAILVTFDYPYLFILGGITLIGAVIFHFFTIDPTNSHRVQPELRGGER
jgi:predicted MFS family arabinose efflux permease